MVGHRVQVCFVLVVLFVVLAQATVEVEEAKASDLRDVVTARQRGPFNWSVYPFGWGWGIAAFVIAIVKGAIWLGIIMIWAFFKGFPAKHGCAPIILRESVPYYPDHHDHHHGHEEIIWDKPPHRRRRSARDAVQPGAESDLLLTDMITDLAFSFLGVHSTDCRKRFVCEVDMRARSDFLLKLGTRMLGVDIFRRYRSPDDVPGTSMEQCAQLYPKCKSKAASITMNTFEGPMGQESIDDYDESLGSQDEQQQNG